ncbi:MAG: hypothetical protein NVS3B5_15900 [Sphingomicrobium sp.]
MKREPAWVGGDDPRRLGVARHNDLVHWPAVEQPFLFIERNRETERGLRQFAGNDRILFLKNERELSVKNGSLGTIEKASRDTLAVRLDDGRKVEVDLKSYAHFDHGYAATVHKTHGMTVDRTHVLATPGMDAHSSYVALSGHLSGTALHYGRDDFADEDQLRRTLARERPKDMALDYADSARETGKAERTATSDRSSSAATGKAYEAGHPGHVLAPGELAHTERAKALRAMVAAREAAPKPTAESVRSAIAAIQAARERSAEQLRETFAALATAPQPSAEQLRETFAALACAPQRSAEQTRAAFAAAAKAVPTPAKDRDYGAEL